jgi:DNA-binding MarR family transcriptional regulator
MFMTTLPSDAQLTAWRLLLSVHAACIDQIDRSLAEAQRIPLRWYDVLIELAEAPEQRLRMHELARSVVLSRSGLTRLVDRLEEAGYLYRQPDPQDRRGSFAVLTDAGRMALRQAWPVYGQGIEYFFGRHLSDAEAATLAAAFERILASTRDT